MVLNKPAGSFKQRFTKDNFTNTNTVMNAGVYTKIYQKVVPAQQLLTYGTGQIVGGVDNRGLVFINVQSAPATPILGSIRLKLADANEFRPIVVFEERSEILSVTKTDRQTGYFLSEFGPKAGEDSLLIIEFKPDATATLTTADTDLSIPVTVYY